MGLMTILQGPGAHTFHKFDEPSNPCTQFRSSGRSEHDLRHKVTKCRPAPTISNTQWCLAVSVHFGAVAVFEFRYWPSRKEISKAIERVPKRSILARHLPCEEVDSNQQSGSKPSGDEIKRASGRRTLPLGEFRHHWKLQLFKRPESLIIGG